MSARRTRSLLLVLSVLTLSATARAALINLDINDNQNPDGVPAYTLENYTGAAVVGTAGDQWNYLNPPTQSAPSLTASALSQSNGAATTVSFTSVGSNFNNHRTATNALLNDYLLALAPGTFTIANLLPGKSYDLYLYSTAGSVGLGGAFTVNGGSPQSATGTVAFTGYVLGENYLQFFGVTADGSGNINGTFAPGTSGLGALNGFQISGTFLPEPASLSLIAILAVPMLRRNRQ